MKSAKRGESNQVTKRLFKDRSTGSLKAGTFNNAIAPVQKVWCAPFTDAGEWVVTWSGVPEATAYEVQTSLDSHQWSKPARFSGTRAVLLIGPAQRCWVRVRALGQSGPGTWSEASKGQKTDGFSIAV